MGLVFSIQTRGGATESAQDNRISTHSIHQGWQYGTVRICVLRTLHLEPYRTYVQYLSSIFEVYRTITKKGVPYSTSY